MKNGKQPITPSMWTRCGTGEDDYRPLMEGIKTGYEIKFGGLTKREYFAGLALQGTLSNPTIHGEDKMLCKIAINLADELLKQLEE